jgi:ABC-type sugar transport system permease subunit
VESLVSTIIGVSVALAALAALFTGANLAIDRMPQRMGRRVRPWVFVGPALAFLAVGLVVPAVRTIVLSFQGGRAGEEGFTFETWTDQLTSDRVISFQRVGDIFTSRLFLVAVALGLLGIALGARAARRSGDRGADVTGPGPSVALVVAGFLLLTAVFSTLRGVIWNNLWWVLVVVGFSTALGLLLAVLADRSRREGMAKALIFMPMAISMVGAAVIWTQVYNVPGSQAEGLLNVLWPGGPIDFLRGTSPGGSIAPWNNFFIMLIMVWIQAGFAMVVLSAGIKSVPAELTEAARVDGATEVQVFWRVTLPHIAPTVLVVVTTLTVIVLKIFDIVKATTGGAAGTDVLANRMYEALRNGDFTTSSVFAVMILVLVLPVMWLNARRDRQEGRT